MLSNTANVQWEDAATAQNVFAYLTSIYGKTADLAREYGIHINDWDPLAEGIMPNAQGVDRPQGQECLGNPAKNQAGSHVGPAQCP